MLLTLAQQSSRSASQASSSIFDTVGAVFSRGDALAHPQDLLPHLQSISIVWAVIFLIAGMLCLLNGYRYYRVATVVLALAIGAFAGYQLGEHIGAPEIVAGSLALLLAVMCWPLMKYAVAVMGGLVGAWIGANAWTAVATYLNSGGDSAAANAYWVGALIGLIVCGMLAFILFKLSVILFTSVSGATIAVLSILALLLQISPEGWRESITDGVSAHALIVPLLVLVPALIGLILQEMQPESAKSGKS